MAIAIEVNRPLVVYQRDHENTEPGNVMRICVGELGKIEPNREDAVRNRSLAIGIGSNKQLVVAYPKISRGLQGFHAESANCVAELMRDTLVVLLHGSVSPRVVTDRLLHVISVYKMDPEDYNSLGGEEVIRGIPRRRLPLELGRLYPERFIFPWIAQRLLKCLGADWLEVIYGKRSDTIYNLREMRRLPAYQSHRQRQSTIPAARYLTREGD